jgi:hypothetical protein
MAQANRHDRDLCRPVLIPKARRASLSEKTRKSEFSLLRNITLVILRDYASSLGSSEWRRSRN